MHCPNCGSELPENSRFCTSCGADLSTLKPTIANAPQGNVATATMPVAATAAAAYQEPAPFAEGSKTVEDYNPAKYSKKEQRAQKKAAQEEYRNAKTAYKDARAKAGKSNKPKIILLAIAALCLIAASSGITWYIMNQQMNAALDNLKATYEQAQAADGAASSASEASEGATAQASSSESQQSQAATSSNVFVGTWSGRLVETTSSSQYRCYGAEAAPIEITVVSVDSNGKMKVDVKMTYHDHDVKDLTGDVDSHDGDTVITVKGLTCTLHNDSFELTFDVPNSSPGNTVRINAELDTQYSNEVKLQVSAISTFKVDDYTRRTVTDSFTLSKASSN